MKNHTGTQPPSAAILARALRPMSESPKDGTEILAFHKEGKNLHPIIWKDWPWLDNNRPHWGMRWNNDYSAQDGCYAGWIPYPAVSSERGNNNAS